MKQLLAVILLLIPVLLPAQRVRLSDQAQFSIVTLGPDQEEFYEAFGHSAIRLVDPVNNIDYAYNYGVFSFNQPNFYLNFAKGHLNYCLAIQSYPDFRDTYIYFNRFIHEQILNLSPQQKQKVFEYLQWNAQPENKYYLYDYFFNNCSTKIRDVFVLLLKDDLHFDLSFIKTHYSLRQLYDLYLVDQPWGKLGIDIGLGSRIDHEATPYEYMYLPDYLESCFDHATIKNSGTVQPLVRQKLIVYQSLPEDDSPGWAVPGKVLGFVLLLAAIITYFDVRKKRLSSWFDVFLFSVTGLLGVVLMLLWFATDHHACARNYNLLWALPTNLVAAVAVLKKNKPSWLKAYFIIALSIAVMVLLLWFLLPQQLNGFLSVLILALGLRYFANWYLQKK